MAQMTATDKLFGESTISEQQGEMAKKTYLLLFLSVFMAVLGGGMGMSSEAFLSVAVSRPGFLVAFLVINLVPYIALWASKKNTTIATLFLGLDGFLSGLALSPLLFIAKVAAQCGGLSNDMTNCSGDGSAYILAALAITLASFVVVTLFVWFSKQRFVASKALMFGLFVVIVLGVGINLIFQTTILATIISIAIGIYGLLSLIYATSTILNDPDYNNPVYGALFMFAALFNIFVAALRLILTLSSRR